MALPARPRHGGVLCCDQGRFSSRFSTWLLLHPQHCPKAGASLIQGALFFFFFPPLSVQWKTLLLPLKLGLLVVRLVVS